MRICIYGAGAVGSLIGSELAHAGHDVTLIGRGAHMAVVRDKGLIVRMNGVPRATRPRACTDPAEAGRQDLVIMATKAHHVPDAASRMAPLLGPETPVLAAQNGIPWWYFHKIGGALEGRTLDSLDPNRRAWSLIGPERVLGCVINASCEMIEPGVVDHPRAKRVLTIGEPDGTVSRRARSVADTFAGTAVTLSITDDIRRAIWIKLMSNLSNAPLNVLTRTIIGQLAHDPACRAISARLIREMGAVARAGGIDIMADIEARVAAPPSNSDHKTSMLQDLERGRQMEIDSIVGAVAEIGRMAGVETPWIDAIYALVRRLAEATGCNPPNEAFKLAVA